jgi:hypothetical protein
MADSDALRSRRKRAHAAGDHHLCRHRPQPPPVTQLPQPEPGDDLDPAAELRRLAGCLVAAYRADPGNASLAREARMTLLALGPGDGSDLDPELREMFEAFR